MRANESLPGTEINSKYMKLYIPHPLVTINKSTKHCRGVRESESGDACRRG